jgi:hypothetical protein
MWFMSKQLFITLVFLLVSLPASPALAFDITPGVSANNDLIEGRILFGDPNGGSLGPWVELDGHDTSHLYGLGLAGTYDVSAAGRNAVSALLSPPNTWWELLGALGGRVYLLAKVGEVDIVHARRASAEPGVGIALGPFYFEQTYRFVESGGSSPFASGYVWQLGIGRPFRF